MPSSSSWSTAAVAWIVSRSARTWPTRGARTERAEAERDVDVGDDEHARVVERPQEAWRVARPAGVEAIRRRDQGAPRSKASLSASTSAALGCQAQTPHGTPSTTGVAAPVIPRRNR
jgi:hypothetical protein